MADRELTNILSSGEVTNIQLGGVLAGDAVPKKSELDPQTLAYLLANIGLVVMNGNSLTPQTINVTPTKVVLFDSKPVEEGTGAVGDIAQNRASATLDGVFKIRFEAFVSYASNVDITWQIYKNGSPFGNSITLSGSGAKVFPITLLTSTDFLSGDYLELYATASTSTTLTVAQANGTLEKTIF